VVESNSPITTRSLFFSDKFVNIAWKYGLADAKITLCANILKPFCTTSIMSQKTLSLKKNCITLIIQQFKSLNTYLRKDCNDSYIPEIDDFLYSYVAGKQLIDIGICCRFSIVNCTYIY